MKLYRNAIILLVILGALVGAYFLISNKINSDAADDTATLDPETINVVKFEKDNINYIGYDNEYGKFSISLNGDTWSIEPAMEFTMDSLVANAAAIDISAVIADKVIEEDAKDLAKYGLDKPSTVTVGLKDGTKRVIEFGDKTPTNDAMYVKMKDENKVYTVGSYYFEKLLMKRGQFIIQEILPVEETEIKTFSITKDGTLLYSLNFVSDSEVDVTAPIVERGDATKTQPIKASLVTLKMTDIVDENPTDLAKYGLENPKYVIEFGTSDTTKKIAIGNDISSGAAYAKFVDSKGVFELDTSPLTFLDMGLTDVLDVFVYLPNITDVSSVEINIDGKKVVSEITHSGDNEQTFKVEGKDANMKNDKGDSVFRAYYQAIIGLTFKKYDASLTPTGTPEVTIKYNMKDGKTVTVGLISKDNNYYYAMKDGKYTGRLILKTKLDESDGIRPTLDALLQAINK